MSDVERQLGKMMGTVEAIHDKIDDTNSGIVDVKTQIKDFIIEYRGQHQILENRVSVLETFKAQILAYLAGIAAVFTVLGWWIKSKFFNN